MPPGQRERKERGVITWDALSAAYQGHIGSSCILASFGVRPIVCGQEREKRSRFHFHFHSGEPLLLWESSTSWMWPVRGVPSCHQLHLSVCCGILMALLSREAPSLLWGLNNNLLNTHHTLGTLQLSSDRLQSPKGGIIIIMGNIIPLY